MRIALAFVPEWRYCRQPYLALPCLAAAVRRAGHEARCYDLNLGFVDYMAGDGLDRLCCLAAGRLGSSGGMDPSSDLAWLLAADREWIRRRLKDLLDLVRDPARMDDVHGHRGAAVIVDRVWDACRALLGTYGGRAASADFQEESWERVLSAACAPGNPFSEWLERACDDIELFRPDVIGLSVAAAVQLSPAITLAAALRRRGLGPVCLGGNVVTRLTGAGRAIPELCSVFDALLPGEGETAVTAMLDRLGRGEGIAGPGVVCVDSGRVAWGEQLSPPPVAELSPPDFTDFRLDRYLAATVHLPVLAGRGCYWRRCAFCAHHSGYDGHRPRTAGTVAGELRVLAERYGVDTFSFEDDDLSPRILEGLAGQLRGGDLRWGCYARLERDFDPGLCARLAQAGCRYLFFGLESGCQRTLDRMDKGIDLASVPAVLEACRNSGIYVHLSVQSGFPGETRTEAEQTLEFIDRHHSLIDGVSWQPFRLEPLSPLGREPERHGVRAGPFAGELALYRGFDCEGGALCAQDTAELQRSLARMIVAHAPSFILNHFPAYYAYGVERGQLVSWWETAAAETRSRVAAVMTGAPVSAAPWVTVLRHDTGTLAFDWSAGTVSAVDGEIAAALLGGQSGPWRPPPRAAVLFQPGPGR